MSITAQQVKELRDKTGVGMMDCKRALVAANGDVDEAVKVLREKGLAKAAKRAARQTSEGVIVSYVHGDRIGVLLEMNCETDFVARNEEFRQLARNLALQVASMGPLVVGPEDLPEEVVQAERDVYVSQCADKPEHIRERIVEGKLEAYYETVCLLNQQYVRAESGKVKVADIVSDVVARLGENIRVSRFVRWELGGAER